jgi:biopolymer transport protein ExbD
MLKYGGRRRRSLPVAAEINITNLVDVAFVLLIIFMITAPIMQGGIEVQLANAEAQPLEQTDPITLSIAANGDLFVGEAPVGDLDEMETVLRTLRSEESAVALKPDRAVPFERIAQVLGRLQKLEMYDVGFVVQPTRNR